MKEYYMEYYHAHITFVMDVNYVMTAFTCWWIWNRCHQKEGATLRPQYLHISLRSKVVVHTLVRSATKVPWYYDKLNASHAGLQFCSLCHINFVTVPANRYLTHGTFSSEKWVEAAMAPIQSTILSGPAQLIFCIWCHINSVGCSVNGYLTRGTCSPGMSLLGSKPHTGMVLLHTGMSLWWKSELQVKFILSGGQLRDWNSEFLRLH